MAATTDTFSRALCKLKRVLLLSASGLVFAVAPVNAQNASQSVWRVYGAGNLDEVLDEVTQWQQRPLEAMRPIV
jgi:hypothetical protein